MIQPTAAERGHFLSSNEFSGAGYAFVSGGNTAAVNFFLREAMATSLRMDFDLQPALTGTLIVIRPLMPEDFDVSSRYRHQSSDRGRR